MKKKYTIRKNGIIEKRKVLGKEKQKTDKKDIRIRKINEI